MDAVFRTLADSSGRQLLDGLRAGNGQTLAELCEGRGITCQAVTKHLAVLEAANLVATVKRGGERRRSLNAVPINEIGEQWIGKYGRSRGQAVSDVKRDLEGTTDEQGRDDR